MTADNPPGRDALDAIADQLPGISKQLDALKRGERRLVTAFIILGVVVALLGAGFGYQWYRR